LANPFALLRGKRLVVNVESSWLIQGPDRADWKHRLMDMNPIREWMARWSCGRASLALFTQSAYRDALCKQKQENAYVTPAVWVNDADILDDDRAIAMWAEKSDGPVRLLFAGRLTALKGVPLLLSALRYLDTRGFSTSVDIIGEGEYRVECVRAAKAFRSVHLSVLDPVPYGRPFFDLVGRYHAVLVPSLSDEQPRIVFDANAQAVPVIAADTDGLRPHVDRGKTGWLVRAGDVESLASAIMQADRSISELRAMGLLALHASRGLTHREMHCNRSHLIARHCS
jgi:glycosyltransferase involved in cell wall biosynthesis